MNARLQMLHCEWVTYDTRVLAGNICGIRDTHNHISCLYGRSVQILAISKASFPQRGIESTIRCAINGCDQEVVRHLSTNHLWSSAHSVLNASPVSCFTFIIFPYLTFCHSIALYDKAQDHGSLRNGLASRERSMLVPIFPKELTQHSALYVSQFYW